MHHANLFDRVEQTTGIVPFGRLVDQVMTVEPYRSARTVYWIVDNGSSHAGKTSIKRMADAYPNARLIHLPVHASWLNQIEIYFSIVQRKALTPNDFATLPELARHLMDFGQHYRTIARPFKGPSPAPSSTPSLRRSPRMNPAHSRSPREPGITCPPPSL